jgi:hypothetical protein
MADSKGGDKAYAALITIDWTNQDVMWTIFEESDRFPDPLLSARALAHSVAPDWPNHEQKIIGNERAGELQARRILGGSD